MSQPSSVPDEYAQQLQTMYASLGPVLDSEREDALFRLARYWLLRFSTTGTLPVPSTTGLDLDTLLGDSALAFFLVFGMRIWPSRGLDPSQPDELWLRRHLRSPRHVSCLYLRNELRDSEYESRNGRPPPLYQERFCTMQWNLKQYLEIVNQIPWNREQDERGDLEALREDQVIDYLFAEVVRADVVQWNRKRFPEWMGYERR